MLNRSVPSFFHGKATSERPFCASNAVAHFPFAFSPSSPGSQPTAMSCFLLVLDERRLQILGLRGLGHFWQRLENFVLGEVNVHVRTEQIRSA